MIFNQSKIWSINICIQLKVKSKNIRSSKHFICSIFRRRIVLWWRYFCNKFYLIFVSFFSFLLLLVFHIISMSWLCWRKIQVSNKFTIQKLQMGFTNAIITKYKIEIIIIKQTNKFPSPNWSTVFTKLKIQCAHTQIELSASTLYLFINDSHCIFSCVEIEKTNIFLFTKFSPMRVTYWAFFINEITIHQLIENKNTIDGSNNRELVVAEIVI